MREIKFRAWNSEEKKMVKVDSICFNENGLIDITCEGSYEGSYYDPVDEYIIMQYTGLKDKNGKEIYEGDIIAVGVTKSINIERRDCPKYKIIFTDGYFGMKYLPDKELTMMYCTEDSEIIGNIYENPELLKESNE